MLIRLWWKEFRVFGPVLLILVIGAGLFQWLFLSTGDAEIRNGGLTSNALMWAVLYAFAVAAAAFSGERESNTLGYLDALPVPRAMLWLGKVSFAWISTAALIAVLIGLAALGTTSRDPQGSHSWHGIFELYVPLLVGGLAWGLWWSSVSRNTLLAAVLAVVSVSATWLPFLDRTTDTLSRREDWEIQPWLILIPLAALAASLLAMAWRPTLGWSLVVRDSGRAIFPVETDPASLWGRVRKVLRREIGPPLSIKAPISRRLFWQVARESWPTALLVGFTAFLMPVLSWITERRDDGPLPILLATLASLVAGVSVFGSENAGGSRSFLVHHGVKPVSVWWRRLAAWGLFVALILGVLFFRSRRLYYRYYFWERAIYQGLDPTAEHLLLLVLMMVNAFAVGVVCGMAIRRRITAGLVGTVALVVLLFLQLALLAMGMIPTWTLVLIPSTLLAISAAWSGDWLLEPQGFARWVRLGLLVVVPFGLLAGIYTTYRGFGVTRVASVAISREEVPTIPAKRNAADLYRKATGMIRIDQNHQVLSQSGRNGVSPVDTLNVMTTEDMAAFFEVVPANREAIDLVKTASSMPDLSFHDYDQLTIFSLGRESFKDLQYLVLGIAIEARDRLFRGDLAGAWDDILIQLRIANQLVQTTPTLASTRASNQIHHRAVGQAFYWLADPRQTREVVAKALADLKALPELPNLSRCLSVEALAIDRACDLPGDVLTRTFAESEGRKSMTTFELLVESWLVTPAWERQRARRICRALIADDLRVVAAEPWKRGSLARDLSLLNSDYLGSPLAMKLWQEDPVTLDRLDREIVKRRALDQLVALVLWRFDHEGKDASKLDDLVPSLLEKLPLDPYSGQPFGYLAKTGAIEFPIIAENPTGQVLRMADETTSLLYSVGPDLKDDGAKRSFGTGPGIGEGDLIFWMSRFVKKSKPE